MTEPTQQNNSIDKLDNILMPQIYSSRAIWGFSFFFTALFGGILLMQNLKDVDKKKEANIVLAISAALTLLTIVVGIIIDTNIATLICNILGASLLSQYFYKKYLPNEPDYEKKEIWKPLIIGIIICVAFVCLSLWAQNQVIE